MRTPVLEAPGGHRLAGIYVLHPGPPGGTCRIEAIDRREAFIQLTRHAYAASVLERTQAQTWHGMAVAEIVRQVPVRRLVVERDLGALDALIGLVRDDIRSREGRGLTRTSAS